MNEDKARKRFQALIDVTRKVAYERFSCQATYGCFDIKAIMEDGILLDNGTVFRSRMLAQVMEKAQCVIVLAVTVHGYEAVEKENDGMMETLFYDAWGTAFVEAATTWYQNQLNDEVRRAGMFTSYSWSPGQHHVDISLQVPVFELIHPEEIGMTLNAGMLMYPKKSSTGIIGVGHDSSLTGARACDYCDLRDTCPSAYAVE